MELKISLPKWQEGRKDVILERLREAMDSLGIFQYELKCITTKRGIRMEKDRIKKYRKKIRELREIVLRDNLIISQEEYGLCEKINWNGETYFD